MAYQITSGEIGVGILYSVTGAQSVVYNSTTYTSGQRFRGVPGVKTFTYSGSGTQEVNEALELAGGSIGFLNTSVDDPVYPDPKHFTGMSVELALTDAEKVVSEVTKLQGFALELIDYPFYSFEIIEARL